MSNRKFSDSAAKKPLPWQIRARQSVRLTPEEIEALRQNGIRRHALVKAELDRLGSKKLAEAAYNPHARADALAKSR